MLGLRGLTGATAGPDSDFLDKDILLQFWHPRPGYGDELSPALEALQRVSGLRALPRRMSLLG